MKILQHKSAHKQIWLLLDSKQPGGIESHIFQLALGLHTHNAPVKVIFLTDYGDHPLRNALHKHNISTMSLDGKFFSLWKAMSVARPLVIHTHGYKAGIYGRILARLCKLPVASTFHAGETTSGKLGFYCWLDKLTARLAHLIFAVSPQIATSLPGDTRLADNFIDMRDIQISNGNQLAFVGRLSKEKAPDRYLLLASQFPELNFHIYGNGPQKNTLQNQAPDNICFHGQQSDMTNIWPKIGLLIIPSRYEGLPMAALEAMARGIPVLAFSVGALDQLIDSDNNGWLVKPGDNKQLANCLHLWTNMSNKQRHYLKKNARKKISQRFSADIAIPELINRYNLITN